MKQYLITLFFDVVGKKFSAARYTEGLSPFLFPVPLFAMSLLSKGPERLLHNLEAQQRYIRTSECGMCSRGCRYDIAIFAVQ